MRRLAIWGTLVYVLGALAEAGERSCDPAPEVKAPLRELEARTARCRKEPACLAAVDAAWRELIGRYPRDVRLHRGYQGSWPGPIEEKPVYYKRLLDERPDDPFLLSLYARSLPKERVPEQLEILAKALAADPTYPWAHFSLAWIYAGRSGEAHRDLEKAKPHVKQFLESCPGQEFGMGLVTTIGDRKFDAELAASMRRALDSSENAAYLVRLPAVWGLEFRSVPPSEHQALRARIAADVKRLRALARESEIEWWQALQAGYEQAEDRVAQQAVRQDMLKRFPCERASADAREQQWTKDHKRPGRTADEATQKQYAHARYRFDVAETELCPERFEAWVNRVRAAKAAEVPASELEATVAGFVARFAQAEGLYASVSAEAAIELILNHRLDPAPLRALFAGWDAAPSPFQFRAPADEKEAEKARASQEETQRRWQFRRLWLQARADNRLGRKAERDAAVQKLKALLEPPGQGPTADVRHRTLDAQYAWLRAEIADGDGRTGDMLALYLKAYAGLSFDPDVVRVTRAALKRMGASDDVLAEIVVPRRTSNVNVVASGPTPWKAVERKLPALSLDSRTGAWTSDEFKGKRTLVNFWATWCGPCKEELPEIQKLHDKLKGRKDVAVLTFNVDNNPGLVDPFMKENNYSFPVLYADAFWDGLDVDKGIPTNWIVDGDGVVRFEHSGFSPSMAARWAADVLVQLEGKPAADEKKVVIAD